MRFTCLVSFGVCLPLLACQGDDTGGSETATESSSSSDSDDSSTSQTSDSDTTTGGETGSSSSGSGTETGTSTTSGPTSSTTTADPTTGSTGSTGSTGGTTTTTGDTTTTGGLTDDCLLEGFLNENTLSLDYDQYSPIIGSHCKGTNHQDITDIERVVFLGDSVTVGTPPTQGKDYYRSRLADILVERFGLEPPSNLWKQVNLIDGVALQQESGDFASCSKWGARVDDFFDSKQIEDCLPPDLWDKRTLVVITMGGNDMASIVKKGAMGQPFEDSLAEAEAVTDLMREAVEYIADDEKFPNGIFVVFANVYEYTDGTGQVASCEAAGLDNWDDPSLLIELLGGVNERYMGIAVDTNTDMIFMQETFCGHGYQADNPNAPCYRGPDQKNYFDLTCIHPTPKGHGVIADLFTEVVDE